MTIEQGQQATVETDPAWARRIRKCDKRAQVTQRNRGSKRLSLDVCVDVDWSEGKKIGPTRGFERKKIRKEKVKEWKKRKRRINGNQVQEKKKKSHTRG